MDRPNYKRDRLPLADIEHEGLPPGGIFPVRCNIFVPFADVLRANDVSGVLQVKPLADEVVPAHERRTAYEYGQERTI